jgi:hypothetical protein
MLEDMIKEMIKEDIENIRKESIAEALRDLIQNSEEGSLAKTVLLMHNAIPEEPNNITLVYIAVQFLMEASKFDPLGESEKMCEVISDIAKRALAKEKKAC